MNTPKYVASSSLHWSYWIFTRPHAASDVPVFDCGFISRVRADENLYACGAPGHTFMLEKQAFEKHYPGFIPSFEMLNGLECDANFTTSVLKFCILHANGEALDAYLAQSVTLKAVQTALSIGLSGDEFVAALGVPSIAGPSTELPQDMAFTANI